MVDGATLAIAVSGAVAVIAVFFGILYGSSRLAGYLSNQEMKRLGIPKR